MLYAPLVRRFFRPRSVLRAGPLAVLLAGGLLAGCQKPKEAAPAAPRPVTQVVGVARIEPEAGLLDLAAGAEGRVTGRPVAGSQAVRQGQVLLTLDGRAENAQLAQAQASVGTQRAAIEAQAAAVGTLKLRADKAQTDYALNRQLLTVQGITQQTLGDSEATAAQARQDYEKGRAELRQAQARTAELRADARYYAVQAGQKTVVAPVAGQLLEWRVQLGDYVTAGTAVAQLAPAGPLIARTEVDELFAKRIRRGQKADIRSQATGTIVGTGTVYFAAGFLKRKSLFEDETAQEDRRVREVRIRLNPGAQVLINGRVDCIIHLD